MLTAYLAAAATYVVAAHLLAWRLRRNQVLVLMGHFLPTLVAAALAWYFVVRGGQTVAQFAVHDPAVMQLWSAWTGLWLASLLALGMAGAAHAMASLFVAFDPASRSWLPITLGGACVCAMGLLAVFERAPTA